MGKTIELSKAEISLLEIKQNELTNVIQAVTILAQDVLKVYLEGLAKDKGIDLASEDWTFDQEKMGFIKVMKEPKKIIQKGKK